MYVFTIIIKVEQQFRRQLIHKMKRLVKVIPHELSACVSSSIHFRFSQINCSLNTTRNKLNPARRRDPSTQTFQRVELLSNQLKLNQAERVTIGCWCRGATDDGSGTDKSELCFLRAFIAALHKLVWFNYNNEFKKTIFTLKL